MTALWRLTTSSFRKGLFEYARFGAGSKTLLSRPTGLSSLGPSVRLRVQHAAHPLCAPHCLFDRLGLSRCNCDDCSCLRYGAIDGESQHCWILRTISVFKNLICTFAGRHCRCLLTNIHQGTIWALTGVSFIFLPARLYARWTATKRLYWDDFLVTFACIISLAISIVITIFHPVTIELMLIGANLKPFPPNVKIITMQFTRVFTAIPMLFYGGLWCVKLTFLLFFRRLGLRNVTSLRRWWRIVLGVTIVAFLICYTVLPYRCTFVSFAVVASKECQTHGLSFVAMGLNTALDVITDCLSMSVVRRIERSVVADVFETVVSIPILILRRVRISTHQKVVLCATFSLVIITMTFAIVRATVTTVGVKRQIDPLWMYLWTSIELNVGMGIDFF